MKLQVLDLSSQPLIYVYQEAGMTIDNNQQLDDESHKIDSHNID